jgi:hypothetical protein
MKRNSQRGVALVITLILLSVITFMTVTFLALSRRERGAVTTTTDQNTAQLAVDAALERAKAQILASMLASANRFAMDFQVSTNFINRRGFDPGLSGYNPTNVNYDYQVNGSPLNAGQWPQNIANLYYDPRPPVFVKPSAVDTNSFRFFLDLNRNGRFDTNGWLPVVADEAGNLLYTNGPTGWVPVTNFFVGDPEWIGVLEYPGLRHWANNKFVSRYAYAVLPVSKVLDVNYIHNQALTRSVANIHEDGYLRNQGVGSWEINLAAFLCDLNTNYWGYIYSRPHGNFANAGWAFSDAFSILRSRYNGNYNNLLSSDAYYGGKSHQEVSSRADYAFQNDLIDEYCDGPLMTNRDLIAPENPPDPIYQPWVGSDNPNHFFTPQDLFDGTNNTSFYFTNSLGRAGLKKNYYDRYTFYRLMSQLGTDSPPEPSGKININYDNLVQRNPLSGAVSATNFLAWQPVAFFTNTANTLLQLYYTNTVCITNIYVYVNTNSPPAVANFLLYTPNVHRLLQLSANIYDATTFRPVVRGMPYPQIPSVFRPIFRRDSAGNIFIAGYVEEVDARLVDNAPHMVDLTADPNDPNIGRNQIHTVGWTGDPNDPSEPMVHGVPVVIGAKKGLPNFNEFSFQTVVQLSRNLQFRRDVLYGPVTHTNQLYQINITNAFGVEAWNSYRTNYPNPLELHVTMEMSTALTNEMPGLAGVVQSNGLVVGIVTNIPANCWLGYVNPLVPGDRRNAYSFVVPTNGGYWFVTNAVYQPFAAGGGQLFAASAVPQPQGAPVFPMPRLGLTLKNRLLFILVDRALYPNRIIDYANLSDMNNSMDITGQLIGQVGVGGEPTVIGQLWQTNRPNNSTLLSVPTVGIINQIEVNEGTISLGDDEWRDYNATAHDKKSGIDGFRVFMDPTLTPLYPQNVFYKTNLFMQAPFNPAREIYQRTSWQANDPLVHYTVSDLGGTNAMNYITPPGTPLSDSVCTIGKLNNRYLPWDPWGVNPSEASDPNSCNLVLKDPQITKSDDWDFPTNKFPNIGWLGRVHRGTPWQTVYLKSPPVDLTTWQIWSGNALTYEALVSVAANVNGVLVVVTNFNLQDAVFAQPVNDWAMLDWFTTAPDDNAGRGQLSVNQSGLAAWSAVLSGVIVLTNNVSDGAFPNNPYLQPQFNWLVINPAGVDAMLPMPETNTPVQRIVDAINRERANTNRHPRAAFEHLGDILAVPELTTNSPFLNVSAVQQRHGITDDAYERIPQQILSLLKGDGPPNKPRFVVYAYGQALKPANNSIVTSGPFFGLCTNYQVTAELAARAVVRVEGDPDPNQQNNPDPQRRYPPHVVVESFNFLPPD